MRNLRQPKRPHSTISNLEDDRCEGKTPSKLTGSARTTGLMKPPVDFAAKIPGSPSLSRTTSSHKEADDEFTDLEDQLVRDLSTSNETM